MVSVAVRNHGRKQILFCVCSWSGGDEAGPWGADEEEPGGAGRDEEVLRGAHEGLADCICRECLLLEEERNRLNSGGGNKQNKVKGHRLATDMSTVCCTEELNKAEYSRTLMNQKTTLVKDHTPFSFCFVVFFLMNMHVHMHAHTLSLSHTHTHTHTHCQSGK